MISLKSSPCPPGRRAAGVWRGRCACPSARTSPGLSCFCAPRNPRHCAGVSRHCGDSSLRGTSSAARAQGGSAGQSASAPGCSYPQTTPYLTQTPRPMTTESRSPLRTALRRKWSDANRYISVSTYSTVKPWNHLFNHSTLHIFYSKPIIK